MNIWHRRSLHGRLLRRLAVVVTVVVVVSGSAAYGVARHFVSQVFDSWLADTASSLAIAMQSDTAEIASLPASLEAQVRWDETDDTALMVFGSRHGLIAGRVDLPVGPASARQLHGVRLFDAQFGGEPVRVASLVVTRPTGENVTIAIAETMRKRSELAGQILLAALAPVLLLAAAALLLLRAGVNRALLPLDELAAGLALQQPQNLTPLSAVEVPTEIRPFVKTLNELLSRLNDALTSQRDFLAETAHQLRTPLAGLKVLLEDALRHPPKDPAVTAALMQRLLGGVERASRLAAQLLALARAEADATQSETPPETFDLCAVTVAVGSEWLPRLLHENQELILDAPEAAVMVRGQPHLLTEVIDNLLDNAHKYAGNGARIQLTVAALPAPSLTVSDNGPGFPQSLRGRVFKRFARGDQTSSDGAGLGLAIVRKLMLAQGGDALRLEPATGAAIQLKLLTADAPPGAI